MPHSVLDPRLFTMPWFSRRAGTWPLNTKQEFRRQRTAPDLTSAHRQAEENLGLTKVVGRYHKLPRRLEDDFEVSDVVLGTGYNGSVVVAKDRRHGTTFAIKHLNLKDASQEDQKQFANEVQIALQMDHPHVIRLAHVYESDELVSLVMEHCTGGELFDRAVEKKAFDEPSARHTTWVMLLAVCYLHYSGITHRDLKLENFLFDAPGSDHLKLIDFGFSKFSKAKRMREALGTLSYAAPEVLRKSYAHGSCDLWSLGCITFILLFGYMPFHAKDEKQIVRLILSGSYKVKPDHWKRISSEGQDFVRKLLVVNPDDRMTAEQALSHPWIADPGVSGIDLQIGKAFFGFAQACELKKALCQVMALSLTLDQRRRVRAQLGHVAEWARFGPMACDAQLRSGKLGRYGTIDLKELEILFRNELGIAPQKLASVMSSLRALDVDGDGELRFSDFMAAYLKDRIENGEASDRRDLIIRNTFQMFDAQDQGYVTAASMQELVANQEDMEKLFNQKHLSKPGQMNLEEFIAFVKQPEGTSFPCQWPAGDSPLRSDQAATSLRRRPSLLHALTKHLLICQRINVMHN
eukprot:TRINITY_DN14257_c0_g1_i1.p1 TRINITY_DN14257_c0_g1~~TRINITY_DN14257_c0_g1_i1.p1  ORF type:complete len:578 (+),score=123.03 TRINITY_DN14257_c0_g1_i1:164-1897(+)